MTPATVFTLPEGGEATVSPESRGLQRDEVRLLVADGPRVRHHQVVDLAAQLTPGDLLVVNTSATVPSAVDSLRSDGRPVLLHVSTELDDGQWVVEPRLPGSSGPDLSTGAGSDLELAGGVSLHLVAPWPRGQTRLWRARVRPGPRRLEHLAAHGRPIRYGYLEEHVPLADQQTIFARDPGSAEMPSAGRPFTRRVLESLQKRGIGTAEITLHCGLSSPEGHEPPQPERFSVPEETAVRVEAARREGRRIVAVGTTVARALESAVGADGHVRSARGWTDLVLGPDHPARVVTGLVTGWHAPEASHLLLLEAVAGPELVERAYSAAVAEGYLWHELGDSALLLPPLRASLAVAA
jgi:S-adenosylmethionine:tRNA ribosyltransferase-isomerase